MEENFVEAYLEFIQIVPSQILNVLGIPSHLFSLELEQETGFLLRLEP